MRYMFGRRMAAACVPMRILSLRQRVGCEAVLAAGLVRHPVERREELCVRL
jgi:hypothetical protein